MSNFQIKTFNPVLGEILKILLNRMIVECSFPDCHKVAKVVLVYKSAKRASMATTDQYLFG